MNNSINIHGPLIDEILAHVRNLHPQEACGLLVGRGTDAARFLPTTNILASETAYEIDPAELASIFRSLRESGDSLVAIVHSHPRGPAEPSERDLNRAYYPEVAHLIVSLATLESPQLRTFRIIDGQPWEIELHVIL